MHDLLSELRNHSPVGVVDVADQGGHLRIELRYGNAAASVLCRKTTPLAPGDVEFVHDGGSIGIAGGTPAELARAIVGHLAEKHAARATTRNGHWVSATG